MEITAELAPLFTRVLSMSKVSEGELVVLLTEPKTPRAYITAAATASRSLGAEVFELRVPGLGWKEPTIVKGVVAAVPSLVYPSKLLQTVEETLKRADFVIDLIPETIVHIPLRTAVQQAGVRILTIVEPPDALERMMPSEEIKRDVLALKKLLERSRTIRVESEVGTNLHYTLKDYPVFGQYGMADEPGKWDHWPSALVSAYPDESSATGIVVLDRGDIIFPFHSYVRTPITITVEAGRVLDIEGELDAKLMRDYLASWGADDVYGTSHIGFGLHPNAQWSALEFYDKDGTIGMDARSLRGGFIFSTGPHRYAQRYVEAHIDVVMHGCTVLVDEQLVIDQGEYVAKL